LRHPTHHLRAGLRLPNADFLVEVDLLPLLMAGALQLSEVLLDRHPKFTDFSAALLIMGILTDEKSKLISTAFTATVDTISLSQA
jgi:hypothetical protein